MGYSKEGVIYSTSTVGSIEEALGSDDDDDEDDVVGAGVVDDEEFPKASDRRKRLSGIDVL